MARIDIPEGLIAQGRVQDAIALAKTLATAFRTGPFRGLASKAAAVTLPEEQCFLRTIRVPALNEEELEKAIRWEAEAAVPLPQGEAVVSWQVIGKNPQGDFVEVLVAGAPRDLAESYVEVLRRIPMQPVAFEPESLAIARALLRPEDRDAILMIDFGREHTGVLIAQDRVVRVTANIPIASRLFTERIAAARKISLAQAEEAKRQHGIAPEGEGKTNRDALTPLLSDLTAQIQQFFSYFETHGQTDQTGIPEGKIVSAPHIQRVLISGGDALLKGLPEFLTEALRVPVNVGDPYRNFRKIPRKLDRHPLFTTVAGLALYHVDTANL